MRKTLICLFPMLCLLIAPNYSMGQSKELSKLLKFMEGEFSSAKQSKNDSDYYSIYLGMHRIWEGQSNNEGWFYVEQSLMSNREKPYRQRIYHVYKKGDMYLSDIYLIDDPLEYVGNIEKIQKLTRSDLTLKEGCTVYLKKEGRKLYKGETKENTCSSTLRGASYATSEVQIKPRMIYSWDKGLDEDGKQVWGAEKGGYIFKKMRKK